MNTNTITAFTFFLFFLPLLIIAQPPRLVIPIGHNPRSKITELNFSPDRKYFVTVGDDNTVKGWDEKTGKLIYSHAVTQALFTDDSKYILALTIEGRCCLLNRLSGEIIYSIAEPEAKIRTIALSPDKKRFMITTNAEKDNVLIYNISSGRKLRTFTMEVRPYLTSYALFSIDGHSIIIQVSLRDMLIYNVDNGLLKGTLKGDRNIRQPVYFTPDGKKIISLSTNDTLRIWDMKTFQCLRSIQFHSSWTLNDTKIKFSSDSRFMITHKLFDSDSAINVYSLESGLLKYSYDLNRLAKNVSISRDGKKMIFSGKDNFIWIVDIASGKIIVTVKHPYKDRFVPAEIALMNTVNDIAVTAGYDNSIMVTDIIHNKRKIKIGDRETTAGISLMQLSRDEKLIDVIHIDGTLDSWSVYTGSLWRKYSLSGRTTDINTASMSIDEKELVTGSQDSIVRVWDTNMGKLKNVLQGHSDAVKFIQYNRDDRYLVTTSWKDRIAIVWDRDGYKKQCILPHPNIVTSADFNAAGDRIVTGCGNGNAMVWELPGGKLIKTISTGDNALYSVTFLDDSTLITTTLLDEPKVWDVRSGVLKCIINAPGSEVQIVPGSKSLVFTAGIFSNAYWNIQTCKEIRSGSFGLTDKITSQNYTEDGRYLMLRTSDDSTFLVTTNPVHIEKQVYFPERGKITFSRSGNIFYTVNNAAVKIYDAEKFTLQSTFVSFDSAEYFTQIPSGYYQCSPAAAKALYYVTKELKFITFEQLDVKYNRPDKVLEAIGNKDTALIRSYRRAYEKRLKRLGVDTSAFKAGYSVPESDFINRGNISNVQSRSSISLHIKGSDSLYNLDRFNVWVNEVPVYGRRGINIRSRNRKKLDTTIVIALSQGENKIETSVSNVNGTESYRIPLIIQYTPVDKKREQLYFIGIGIDRFSNKTYDLQYSVKDIRDLAKGLKEKYSDKINIDTLFNENVTVEKVKALKKRLLQTSVNDKVIIAYSGHGILDKQYDYFLSTYNVNFKNPEVNGLPYDELENLLDNIPARKKLMLIDACHSGEVDKDEAYTMNKTAGTLGLAKGVMNEEQESEKHLGLVNSFDLMQDLFVNVGRNTGATVISAAAGNQFALESGDLKNGVFTYAILEAMKENSSMSVNRIKKIVAERVMQLTHGLQKPTYRNETVSVDWNAW